MKAKHFFKPGDHVYWVYYEEIGNATCSFCSGTGKIRGHNRRLYRCPRCLGAGSVHVRLDPPDETIEKVEIISVSIRGIGD